MREALARSDLDFTVSEPKEKGRKTADITRLPRILRVASVATACLICAVIVVNALFLQDRKHPAPLLRAPDPAPSSEPVAPAPPAAKPVSAPVAPAPAAATKSSGRDAIADEINRVAAPAERKASKPPVAAVKDDGHADAIADLIGGSGTTEASASVLAAQKALVRLGYVLRADGMRGATTKQAIERYERDNKLPVRGELTPKLARELAAKSGIPAQ